MTAPNLFVLTGGPGSGKTALIEAAKGAGLSTTTEVGRRIIQDEMASGGTALPWADRQKFAERMLEREVAAYQSACRKTGPVLCDRGVPDVLGYARLEGLPLKPFEQAARDFSYAMTVFMAPPWREIFAADSERRQTWEVAVQTHDIMTTVYEGLGYRLVPLPLGSVAMRLEFVRRHLDG